MSSRNSSVVCSLRGQKAPNKNGSSLFTILMAMEESLRRLDVNSDFIAPIFTKGVLKIS